MRRLTTAGLMTVAILGLVGIQEASAQQQISFSVGGFSPRSETSRDPADVLVADLDFLAFRISDFSGPVVGAEYLTALGDHFDAGLGVSFYQRTVPTVYTDYVNANGSEINQNLQLRIVPFTASVRWLPMGHHNGIEPYIGAGVGVFRYRYSETGQFLATDGTIFSGNFVGSGTATGPVILGGLRVPVGPWAVGGELRYQSATGNLQADQNFAGSKIDLGGLTYNFTINIRF
jgi:outer membrane protein W